MIEHLRGREKALEPFGWTGREAEWIALVCLHSGVFTRAKFCFYFNAWRKHAHRFVRTLVEQGFAVEDDLPNDNKGAQVCRISSKRVYRALGVENIRHRRLGSTNVMLRRLLSLDYVLEHPELIWLPTEPEKVRCFETLGLTRRLMPHRIYRGVVAIAGNHEPVERAEGLLRAWASTAPRKQSRGLTVKEEIERINDALNRNDRDVLAEYGGFNAALRHGAELEDLPEAQVTDGVSIDDYATWRATRFAVIENGVKSRAEDSWTCAGSRGQIGR